MLIIEPWEAFAQDAVALNVEEDESRLPIRWLAAAQVAFRLMGAEPRDRRKLVATWVKQAKLDGPDGVWSALAVPGITVTGAETACETLLLLADNMVGGGAHHLAYATVTNVRIAMLDSGPAGLRAQSAVRQAEILQAMGMPDEATDTFECAIEDAIRGRDSETEARARRGMQAVRDAAG